MSEPVDPTKPDGSGIIPEDESLDLRLVGERNELGTAWSMLNQDAERAVRCEQELNANLSKLFSFWSSEQHPDELFMEPAELIRNFLASANTLRDYSRRHIQKTYSGHSFAITHQAMVDDMFKNAPLPQFIQKLRDYNLHYSLPLTSAQFSLDPTSIHHQFLFVKAKLLEWDGWNSESKQFINNQDETFPVMPIISEYIGVVNEFHRWREEQETALFNRGLIAQHGPGSRIARQYGSVPPEVDEPEEPDHEAGTP